MRSSLFPHHPTYEEMTVAVDPSSHLPVAPSMAGLLQKREKGEWSPTFLLAGLIHSFPPALNSDI